jgi:hypothetical protein
VGYVSDVARALVASELMVEGRTGLVDPDNNKKAAEETTRS